MSLGSLVASTKHPRTLTLIRGDMRAFEILFFNEQEKPEDIDGATEASFAFTEEIGVTPVFLRTTAGSYISIDTSNSKLVITYVDQAESDALVPGIYIGGAALHFPDTSIITKTELFHVVVLESPAPDPTT